MEIKNVKSGVSLSFIENKLFKSALLTVRFLLPLKADEITENAMVVDMLSECSKAYPNPEDLQLNLSALYGAEIYSSFEKSGDTQMLTLSLRSLADRYGIGGEKCFTKAAEIFRGLIFEPNFQDGLFKTEDVERAKRRHADIIKGELNDKRIYAKNRMEEIMYKDEAYGLPKNGFSESVENATPEILTEAYKRLIEKATVRVAYVGDSLPECVRDLAEAFPETDRIYPDATRYVEPFKCREIHEKMEVTQGKLVMGFRTSEIGGDRDTVATALAVDIFGGGTYSFLFSEVREKLSLCYYCAARAIRKKGYITVESGVEDKNAQRAKNEILNQLEKVQRGDFSDELIEYSKRSISDSLNSAVDSIASIDYWYGARFLEENPLSPAEMSELIKGVTREEIIESARKIKPDTFYFLESLKGGNADA